MFGLCPNIFSFFSSFSFFCFSVFLCPKIGVLFFLDFSCNQLAILTQSSSDSQAARYFFFKEF